MKKTIITLLALAGAAAGAETIDALTLPDSTTEKPTFDTGVLYRTDATNLLTHYSTAEVGVYCSVNNTAGPSDSTSGFGDSPEGWWNNSNNIGDITLYGRSYWSGEAVTLILESNEFNAGDTITLLNLSATVTSHTDGANSTFVYALGILDSNGTLVASKTGSLTPTVGTAHTISLKWEGEVEWEDGYRVAAGIATPSGGGTNQRDISSLKIGAGFAPIPEPTTATLSLLALAGLAARRRRASR